MHRYLLIAGDRGFRDAFEAQPIKGDGWEVQCDLSDDGKVPLFEVELTAPDGKNLGRLRCTPLLKEQIKKLVSADVLRLSQAAVMPAKPPGPREFRGTTGNAQVAKVKVYQTPDYLLAVAWLNGLSEEYVQILDGTSPIGNVPVHPVDTFRQRAGEMILAHMAGGQPHASQAKPIAPEEHPVISVERDGAVITCSLWPEGRHDGQAEEWFQASRSPSGLADMLKRIDAWKERYPAADVDTNGVDLEAMRRIVAEKASRDAAVDRELERAERQAGGRVQPQPTARDEVAAGKQPEPAKAPTPQAVEAARAERSVGQALSEPPLPIEELRRLPVDSIVMGHNQRSHYDHEKLQEMADSILAAGVVQPISVNEVNGEYRLVAGARRLLASRMARVPDIPAYVRRLTEAETELAMLVENIQREEINPMDEARAYDRLLQIHGSQGEVAKVVGKSRIRVNEYLQLLELPANMQAQVASGVLAVKAGLEFLRKTRELQPEVRQKVAETVSQTAADGGVSQRQAPEVVQKALEQEGVARATPTKREPPAEAPPVPPEKKPEPAQAPAPEPPPTPEPPVPTQTPGDQAPLTLFSIQVYTEAPDIKALLVAASKLGRVVWAQNMDTKEQLWETEIKQVLEG